MKNFLMAVAAVALLASPVLAQQQAGLQAFDNNKDERGEARVLFWDNAKNGAAGEFCITYGRPLWKAEYEQNENFEKMTRGKVWRAGKNFWTTLDSNVPLEIAGRAVAPGAYYLGVHRSDDGKSWSLAFIDPDAARKDRLDAFEIQKAPVAFKVPLAFAETEESQARLAITLERQPENTQASTLKIAWGRFVLTAPVIAEVKEQ